MDSYSAYSEELAKLADELIRCRDLIEICSRSVPVAGFLSIDVANIEQLVVRCYGFAKSRKSLSRIEWMCLSEDALLTDLVRIRKKADRIRPDLLARLAETLVHDLAKRYSGLSRIAVDIESLG